jgi:excisionase family DNA binding protein
MVTESRCVKPTKRLGLARCNVLSVKRAAELLGVSAALVYALCAAGKIRHERHGLGRGTIRIPLEALEEYRKSCTVGVTPPSTSAPASSGPPAAPGFSELDPRRLARAWGKG